jgi:cell division protein FtsB
MNRGDGGTTFKRFRRPRMPGRLPARRLIWIGVTAVLFYLLVLSDFGILRRWALSREAAAIESRISELEEREKTLESRRGELEDDEALERIAREEYGMVRKGEHVYRLSVPDSSRERRRKK